MKQKARNRALVLRIKETSVRKTLTYPDVALIGGEGLEGAIEQLIDDGILVVKKRVVIKRNGSIGYDTPHICWSWE